MDFNQKLEEVLSVVKKIENDFKDYIPAELTNVNNSKVKIIGLLNKKDLENDKKYIRVLFPLAIVFDKSSTSNVPIIPVNFNEEEKIKEAINDPVYIAGDNFLIVLNITDKYELIKEFILRSLMFELQITLTNSEKNMKILEKIEESIKKNIADEKK